MHELTKLEKLLIENDLATLLDTKSEYELFRSSVPGGIIVAYSSGKLVINTNAAHEFITN